MSASGLRNLLAHELSARMAERGLTYHQAAKEIGVATSAVCRYRGPNGTACAVGGQIPDHLHTPDLEHCGSAHRLPELIIRAVLRIEPDEPMPVCHDPIRGLLSDLQRVHDRHQPNEWELRWVDVSKSFGLVYTPPETQTPEFSQ